MKKTPLATSMRQSPNVRLGFTLTEMLVSVGLLMVIMVIFAQIFQLAVTAMSSQKGLANNDQRARTAFSVIDADLKRMSYRSIYKQGGIVPLVPGLLQDEKPAAVEQEGYFYYSENNPHDDTDDVLQFTVDASLVGKSRGAGRYAGQSELPFYGKAGKLDPYAARRQPDRDDGILDEISVSKRAEVIYFLRHGSLYRRVLLIRDTDDNLPVNMRDFVRGDSRKTAQPAYLNSDEPYDMMRDYTDNFYTDFDFSAHNALTPFDEDLTSPTGLRLAVFHGSLSNDPLNNWPLGIPHFRFGFSPASGRPREFVSDGTNRGFIGRYTHEETSHVNFQYPQTTTGNIFGRTDFDISALRETGRLNVFANGPRRGADILLNNVHGFDVEIWDSAANSFVSIGNSAGDFAGTQNSGYFSTDGPGSVSSNIFDTWHSVKDITEATGFNLTQIGNGQPPFVPKHFPVSAGTRWTTSMTITTGLRVFPSSATAVPYGDAVYWVANVVDRNNADTPIGNPVRYSPPPTPAPVEPWLNRIIDLSTTESSTPQLLEYNNLQPDPPYTGNTVELVSPVAGIEPEIRWVPVDNRKPIKAMRITIRFLDPTSQQMRQVSLVHSFNEDGI